MDTYIFGAAGFGKEVFAMCKKLNIFVTAFVDDKKAGDRFHLTNVICENEYKKFAKSTQKLHNVIIAIGNPNIKENIYNKIKNNIIIFPELIYGNTIMYKNSVVIDFGSIICPGVIMTIDIIIGKFCHINLHTTIGHDTTIGDYTTIAPGVNISGNVHIGKKCYIGTNVSIKEKINIVDNVTVGMGAVVVKNITEPGTYIGNPLRKLQHCEVITSKD